MARTMDAATIAAQESQVVREAFIVRLDIDGDEFLAWTGLGTYTPSGTGDNAIEALVNRFYAPETASSKSGLFVGRIF